MLALFFVDLSINIDGFVINEAYDVGTQQWILNYKRSLNTLSMKIITTCNEFIFFIQEAKGKIKAMVHLEVVSYDRPKFIDAWLTNF